VLPQGKKLWAQVRATDVLGELRFVLPPTKQRKSRPVRKHLRAKRLSLYDQHGGQLQVTCLIATEINAPAGETPIEWRLLTNREVNDFAAGAELVDWYRARWEIELFSWS
jgi:hypothetical protein